MTDRNHNHFPEVTKMVEYIDKQAAIRALVIDYAYSAADILKKIPASNVLPVVYGEWKEYDGDDSGFHYCSVCKGQAFNYDESGETIEVLSNFCPNCGADMRGEKERNNG